MDGSDPPTRCSKPPVTRAFEATRLADDVLSAADDRLLAATGPAGPAEPASRPSGRRTTVTVPTPTGGRGR
ncbi:hypothetical protein [Fimbriiglobus ruber]|uniref:Uncharacterized protein n=1 Tax=Fimbriiglobus ruber TaxID=1908690 RepID=A0A225DAQ7_9BACT|nr:hypothetical protein [Fimbriiglobus ruber]OWK35628.1 hypothetical protein FRUB_08191 [Fimbriiglobus ruber]